MFLQAQQAKNQNQQQLMQAIGQGLASAGQGVGQGLQRKGQMQATEKMGQALNPIPGQEGPETMGGVGPSDVNWGNVISQATKAGIDVGPIMTQMVKNKMNPSQNKLPGEVWVNPQDPTDLSPTQKQGYIKYTTTQGDALSKLTGTAMGKQRNEAMKGRAEAWERSIDARQIDNLAKSTSLTTQQRNILQQNNMRANRAIQIANGANTWQEFGAMVTDAGAVMQGGVPHVDQLHNMAYPSWKQDLARIQTYMSSTPQETVPQEFKDRVIKMMQGIQEVDNKYLTANAKFMQQMLSPTIRGGGAKFNKPVQDIIKSITETIPYTGGKSGDLSSMRDDELRKIAGGQ